MDDMDSGSFFDHIDDLVEFPSDNDCGVNEILRDSGGGCNDFPSIWDNEALPDAYPPFPESNRIAACELSAELSVPYEDIIQLEWLSTFVEDSFSGGGMTLTQNHSSVSNNNTSQNQFHTSSPVSVLESSSSSSSSTSAPKYIPLGPTKRGPHRARSKRSRPATFNPRSMIQFMCPSPTPTLTLTPSPTNTLLANVGSEHPPAEKLLEAKPPVQKPKKLKIKVPFSPLEINEKTDTLAVRKCMHCEITKTPQWRAGPMGPKTLCNACGVRYKSGRLFPEYRPAASPTFVPSLHSNSHKKVVQMRSNVVVEPTTFKKDSVFVGNKPPGGGYISK